MTTIIKSDVFESELDIFKQSKTIDLGVNATGVINSKLHYDDTKDEYIYEETMPSWAVQECMNAVHHLSTTYRKRARDGAGELIGQLPMPIWHMWKKEWKNTGKKHGILWQAFLTQKIMDSDYSKFRVRK